MKIKKILIWISAFLGIVLIGAIGSGVWDLILKPVLFLARDTILNITVLGMEQLKNNIYEEVSKGFHEKLSLKLYEFTILFFITVLISMVIINRIFLIKLKNKLYRILSTVSGKEENGIKHGYLQELYKEASTTKLSVHFTINIITIIFVIIVVTQLFLSSFSNSYINSAITHFQQMCSIVKPYHNKQQENQIISEFAQIKNKQDYVNVIVKLEQFAKKNNLEIPEFEPW